MRVFLASSLLVGLGVPSEPPNVWVFFSPEAPEASRIFRQLEALDVKARPVLLAERYFGRRAPRRAFLETLRTSGEVLVVDTEGLCAAQRLKIRELPAVAVERGGRTHVASGSRVDVREVMRCAR